MKKLILLPVFILLCIHLAYSQGCIAVRNLVGFGQFAQPKYGTLDEEPVKWMVNVNNRYFKAVHTFDGSTKVNEMSLDKKESKVYVMNLSIMRLLNKGWSYSIDVPVTSGTRTAWREHNVPDSTRFTTNSFGLSDIRLTVYKWLLDSSIPHKGNIQLGVGIKLPTGDYKYQDYFKKPNGYVLAPVNPSIQLGDGGTGFIVEINSFFTLNSNINFYGNLFYLFNPRDHNGVSITTGNVAPAAVTQARGDVNSVPDSYTARAGANFSVKPFTLWTGVRMEGSPVHDVIGASNGQRRAGKIVSVEPGINYTMNKTILYVFTPVPLYRTTSQTVPDKRVQDTTGQPRPSPGGFADYLIFVGVVFSL